MMLFLLVGRSFSRADVVTHSFPAFFLIPGTCTRYTTSLSLLFFLVKEETNIYATTLDVVIVVVVVVFSRFRVSYLNFS